jgi:hypothetical protein
MEEHRMKNQAYNPYLPSWEYIPDGEPYVFDGRVYVYGSHDFFNGYVFCMGDYITWSAPVDDLTNWRYEGVIYPRNADPLNKEGRMCLYAPDIVVGADGRYYLYYVLDKVDVVSVAVSDSPAGKFEFYGYVQYPDGTKLGEKPTDEPMFDPAVLLDGGKVYLYTGFVSRFDKKRTGMRATVLDTDMLTVLEAPVTVIPGGAYGDGTEYEGHAFFEAPTIRKIGDTYYLGYSSQVMHELCYATSKSPREGFKYGGVIVSNCDMGIDTYKPAGKVANFGSNNHGGLVEINGQWYIFYHRHTNGTSYSRQGCAEPVTILPDGSIPQVSITSCGLNGKPLCGVGEYPAYIACNLMLEEEEAVGEDFGARFRRYARTPRVTQDGRDGDENPGHITNIGNGAVMGFKSFDCKGVTAFGITVRAYAGGSFDVKTAWDGEVLASIKVDNNNVWTYYEVPCAIPDGVQDVYLAYHGGGSPQLKSFTLKCE